MSTRSKIFFLWAAFGVLFCLFIYAVFSRILQEFSLRNPFVFAAFFPAFNTFPAPCPSIASGFAAAPCSGFWFYDCANHCTFCRFKERLRAAVCGKQSFPFAVFWRRFCGSSAISWRLWSRQNRFFEDFLYFTKHVLLYKKPARPVSLPYRTLKALLQKYSCQSGSTSGF